MYHKLKSHVPDIWSMADKNFCHYGPFFALLRFYIDYLVSFWIWAEISGMLKKNRLEKLVSVVKRSACLWERVFGEV